MAPCERQIASQGGGDPRAEQILASFPSPDPAFLDAMGSLDLKAGDPSPLTTLYLKFIHLQYNQPISRQATLNPENIKVCWNPKGSSMKHASPFSRPFVRMKICRTSWPPRRSPCSRHHSKLELNAMFCPSKRRTNYSTKGTFSID